MRKHTKIFLALIISCVMAGQSSAQRHETHQLLLFDVSGTGNDLSVANPRLLSGFNLQGYNNQPCFFSDTEVWITTQRPSDTTQTDIVALDLERRALTQVTRTRVAEYSPTPMPSTGGREWSGVVVEPDGVQRLYRFPVQGGAAGTVILPDVKGVGYHTWLNETDLALFIVGEPHTLIKTGTTDKRRRLIASNPGRCMAVRKDGKLLYVSKATDQTWFLKTYDPRTEKQEIVAQTLPTAEDFVLLPDGSVLMGQGAKLYVRQGDTWVQVADLTSLGVTKVTRMALRGEKLAVVVR